MIININTALLAEEKGFKFDEYYKYGKIGEGEWSLESVYDIETLHWGSELTEIINAPTQSKLQKWLREEYGININITPSFQCFNIDAITLYDEIENINIDMKEDGIQWKDFNKYEDALDEALVMALNIIPNKNQ